MARTAVAASTPATDQGLGYKRWRSIRIHRSWPQLSSLSPMDVFQGWVLRRRDGVLCVPADLGMMWLGADYVGGQGLLHPTGPGLVSHGYSKDEMKGDSSCQFSFRADLLAPRNPTKGLAIQEVEQHMALGCL